MKIRYEAENGKLFDTEQECKQYETEYLAFIERIESALEELKNFCINHYEEDGCDGCPFYEGTDCCRYGGYPHCW